jgi:hypothetical protein
VVLGESIGLTPAGRTNPPKAHAGSGLLVVGAVVTPCRVGVQATVNQQTKITAANAGAERRALAWANLSFIYLNVKTFTRFVAGELSIYEPWGMDAAKKQTLLTFLIQSNCNALPAFSFLIPGCPVWL